MIERLRRSILYVPGDSEKMLLKSSSMPADVLLFNLEDGVAGSRKDVARRNVVAALQSADPEGPERIVRINSPDSDTGSKDISGIVPVQPDGICLPKIESASQIQKIDSILHELEVHHGVAEKSIRLHAMIESASGVLNAAEISGASPRMASIIFGSADFVDNVRCRPGKDRQEILLALQMLVLAARTAGIDAIDAPCFDLRNHEQLRRESSIARSLGFDGKSALHPDQLAEINKAFDVTPEEIAWAEKVLKELDEAERRDKALSVLDGILIDNPHRAAAQRILGGKSRRVSSPAGSAEESAPGRESNRKE
ncbi:MAG: CoA ester lyase [Acidobacteriota bacterium]